MAHENYNAPVRRSPWPQVPPFSPPTLGPVQNAQQYIPANAATIQHLPHNMLANAAHFQHVQQNIPPNVNRIQYLPQNINIPVNITTIQHLPHNMSATTACFQNVPPNMSPSVVRLQRIPPNIPVNTAPIQRLPQIPPMVDIPTQRNAAAIQLLSQGNVRRGEMRRHHLSEKGRRSKDTQTPNPYLQGRAPEILGQDIFLPVMPGGESLSLSVVAYPLAGNGNGNAGLSTLTMAPMRPAGSAVPGAAVPKHSIAGAPAGAPPKPEPGADPIILTLAEKAGEDPQFRDFLKKIAQGDAAKYELDRFQAIINAIKVERKRGPSADRPVVDGRIVRNFADQVRAISPINTHSRFLPGQWSYANLQNPDPNANLPWALPPLGIAEESDSDEAELPRSRPKAKTRPGNSGNTMISGLNAYRPPNTQPSSSHNAASSSNSAPDSQKRKTPSTEDLSNAPKRRMPPGAIDFGGRHGNTQPSGSHSAASSSNSAPDRQKRKNPPTENLANEPKRRVPHSGATDFERRYGIPWDPRPYIDSNASQEQPPSPSTIVVAQPTKADSNNTSIRGKQNPSNRSEPTPESRESDWSDVTTSDE